MNRKIIDELNNEHFEVKSTDIMDYIRTLIAEDASIEEIIDAKYVLGHMEQILIKLGPPCAMKLIVSMMLDARFDKKLEHATVEVLHSSIDTIIDDLNITSKDSLSVSYDFWRHLTRLDEPEALFGDKFPEFVERKATNKVIKTFFEQYKKPTLFAAHFLKLYAEAVKRNERPIIYFDPIMNFGDAKNGDKFLKSNVKSLMSITKYPIEDAAALEERGVDLNQINFILDERLDGIVTEMSRFKQMIPFGDYDEETKQFYLNFREIVMVIVKEILFKDGLLPSDIRKLNEGSYSRVYSIGTKVLKIGRSPKQYSIPRNSKRFIQPLVRYAFETTNSKQEKVTSAIEIEEMSDTREGTISKEELYEVYRDIRRDGMIWTDVAYRNVGRLQRDNIVYFEGVNEVHNQNLGFKKCVPIDVLKKGEVVVIDLDFIYDENDPNISYPEEGFAEEFEKRYQRELREAQRNSARKKGKKISIDKNDPEI